MGWCVAVVVMAVVACILGPATGEGGRVLFINPISARSHHIFYMGIVNALADQGNQVTLVTPFKATQARTQVREVIVKNIDISPYIATVFKDDRLGVTTSVAKASPALCSDALAHPNVQSLLKEEFDVVLISIFFADCFLSLVYQLKVPFIWVTPTAMYYALATITGSPQFPAFRGSLLLAYQHPLSFIERCHSIYMDYYFAYIVSYPTIQALEAECRDRGLCPAGMPSLSVLRNNSSMTLLNSVRSLESTGYPTVPSEVYLGGIHCRPARPLPKEMEEWVQGAGEAGFIFFSLGSNILPSFMPEEYRAVLVEVLGSLEQRVLWKWDQDTMADLPPNVRLAKWLPQQDILGDPWLRLFITHGGLLSTQEATYNGVPVLGIPFFADQYNNMQDIENQGWGRSLLWKKLTKGTFKKSILQVMNDENMLREARRRAVLMRDQPQTPAEVATFWVQYVMRHKGAPYLRCPALTMPWYQLYNVDVWATVVVVVVVAVVYVLGRILVALCSRLCCSSTKSKKD